MKEAIYRKRPEIEMLCRKHHVRRLAVFGSAIRDDFNETTSDIDFLVEYSPLDTGQHWNTYFGLIEDLTALFGRKVDLMVWKNVRNPYLRRAVERSHEDLYAA